MFTNPPFWFYRLEVRSSSLPSPSSRAALCTRRISADCLKYIIEIKLRATSEQPPSTPEKPPENLRATSEQPLNRIMFGRIHDARLALPGLPRAFVVRSSSCWPIFASMPLTSLVVVFLPDGSCYLTCANPWAPVEEATGPHRVRNK